MADKSRSFMGFVRFSEKTGDGGVSCFACKTRHSPVSCLLSHLDHIDRMRYYMIESILPLIESNSNYLAVSQFLVCQLFTASSFKCLPSGGTPAPGLPALYRRQLQMIALRRYSCFWFAFSLPPLAYIAFLPAVLLLLVCLLFTAACFKYLLSGGTPAPDLPSLYRRLLI